LIINKKSVERQRYESNEIASRMGSHREQKFSHSLILDKEKKAKALKQGIASRTGSQL
jgi:hypothetical protein